jgi:hypothetical protein
MRFKADESSQAITGPYRQLHPEDNNERQSVHEHVSVALPVLGKTHVGTVAPSASSGQAIGRPAGQRPAALATNTGASK